MSSRIDTHDLGGGVRGTLEVEVCRSLVGLPLIYRGPLYGCMRHDFNWRNLHRVNSHYYYHTLAGTWNDTVRKDADARLGTDLTRSATPTNLARLRSPLTSRGVCPIGTP